MIVVVIIGLLMAIALPNYIRGRRRAARTICLSNQKMIYTQASVYMIRDPNSLLGMSDKERLEALYEDGYLRGRQWMECPAARDGSFDDYGMEFEDNFISDIECIPRGAEHQWP